MAKDTSNKFTPRGFIKVISFLHLGIAATPIVLGTLFYFRTTNTELSFTNSNDMFLAIVPVVAISSIFLGDFVFKKIIKALPNNMTLREKLMKYQTASIIKFALLEGAALFSIVIFGNTQNLTYLIVGLLLIFFLFLQRPAKQKIETTLNLRGEEKAKFDRTDEPLD